ncbi:MAG: cell wall hydrolase [Sphingomicrobium sp.]
MLTLGSGNAAAQTVEPIPTNYSLNSGAVDSSARPLGSNARAPMVSAVQRAVSTTTDMFSNAVGAVFGTPTAQSEATRIAREASWLHRNGWPLYALVDRYSASAGPQLDEETNCIAVAVYHEARGESLEGQLAVARVIMNRAASGKYPPTWCGTVKQPWQFSFVRNYKFPYTDQDSAAWRKALAITRLAINNTVPSLSNDVLWYHADYVSPSWGRRLTYVNKIGTHIFYRA